MNNRRASVKDGCEPLLAAGYSTLACAGSMPPAAGVALPPISSQHPPGIRKFPWRTLGLAWPHPAAVRPGLPACSGQRGWGGRHGGRGGRAAQGARRHRTVHHARLRLRADAGGCRECGLHLPAGPTHQGAPASRLAPAQCLHSAHTRGGTGSACMVIGDGQAAVRAPELEHFCGAGTRRQGPGHGRRRQHDARPVASVRRAGVAAPQQSHAKRARFAKQARRAGGARRRGCRHVQRPCHHAAGG